MLLKEPPVRQAGQVVVQRRVREVVGRDAFIAGTFDPHGNEDAEFLRHADFAFCAKYFPHYDSRLQGERAARMLIRAIRGDYTPVSATVKVPILTATVLQWTGASPWMDLVQRALTWEAREPDLYMNVFFGFPFADVPDVGMTVQAMANGKPELARKAGELLQEPLSRWDLGRPYPHFTGGITERLLQATAASYVVSPAALNQAGADPEQTADRMSANSFCVVGSNVVVCPNCAAIAIRSIDRATPELSVYPKIPCRAVSFGRNRARATWCARRATSTIVSSLRIPGTCACMVCCAST